MRDRRYGQIPMEPMNEEKERKKNRRRMKQIKDHNRPDRQRMSDPNSKVPRSGGQMGPRETLRGQDLRVDETRSWRKKESPISLVTLSPQHN